MMFDLTGYAIRGFFDIDIPKFTAYSKFDMAAFNQHFIITDYLFNCGFTGTSLTACAYHEAALRTIGAQTLFVHSHDMDDCRWSLLVHLVEAALALKGTSQRDTLPVSRLCEVRLWAANVTDWSPSRPRTWDRSIDASERHDTGLTWEFRHARAREGYGFNYNYTLNLLCVLCVFAVMCYLKFEQHSTWLTTSRLHSSPVGSPVEPDTMGGWSGAVNCDRSARMNRQKVYGYDAL